MGVGNREVQALIQLQVNLHSVGIEFKRPLEFQELVIVGQILMDLHYRTNDEENLVNFAVGDWLIKADEWFGEDVGVNIWLQLTPTYFHSCFISYNQRDQPFAEYLYSRLRAATVRVWYAQEDIRGGEKLIDQIDKAISEYDRLIIVLSENSLQSNWVMTEIRRARQAELRIGKRKLFPIRLVHMAELQNWQCFDSDIGKDLAVEIQEFFIPDFSDWENPASFQKTFSKLLDNLRVD